MELSSEDVAIVTGAASGLGRAAAAALEAAGAAVVLVDLPTADGAHAAKQLGARARFVPTDVTDPDGVAQAVGQARELGRLRVAVNAAGVVGASRVLTREGPHDLGLFRSVVEVNLIGTFNVLRLAAEAMAAQEPVNGERGVIVNTASVAAFDGQAGIVADSASKGAIAAMTLPAARDLARDGIRVVAIAPGTFDTPMLGGLGDATRAALASELSHPQRPGAPSEYGLLVRQIVEQPYLNGEVIRLDAALRVSPH